MWNPFSTPVHIVRHAVSFLFSSVNQGAGNSKLSAVDAGFRAGQFYFALKLLWWVADNSFVQRSALITGLSLALCGLTLAGVGEWATGRLESTVPHGGSTAPLAPSSYSHNRVGADSQPLPELPDASDHLPASTPGYTLRRNVPRVRLQFTVADERGRLVNDLSSEDVRIFDNQAPVARFDEFERDDNLPLQLGLLLDTSDSVKRVLRQEKGAAIAFLERVMRPQTDTAFVIAFAGEIKTWQSSTASRQGLIAAIERLQEPGWGTRVFDALYSACSAQLSAPRDVKPIHRALIVLTDGDDTDSLHTLSEVIAVAQRSETQIYPLTIHPNRVMDRGDRVLQRLADSTGGRFYVAPSGKDLDAAFAQIEQDLRTQYYVSFPPQQSTSGFHSLRVEVRAPRKVEVHARQGYYALQQ